MANPQAAGWSPLSPDQVPLIDEDVMLDVAGDYQVSDVLRHRIYRGLQQTLRSDWPSASDSALEEAMDMIMAFHVRVVETGRMNYVAARDLGRNVANVLGQTGHAGTPKES